MICELAFITFYILTPTTTTTTTDTYLHLSQRHRSELYLRASCVRSKILLGNGGHRCVLLPILVSRKLEVADISDNCEDVDDKNIRYARHNVQKNELDTRIRVVKTTGNDPLIPIPDKIPIDG